MGTGAPHRERPLTRSLLLMAAGAALTLAMQQVLFVRPSAADARPPGSTSCDSRQAARITLLETEAQNLRVRARELQRESQRQLQPSQTHSAAAAATTAASTVTSTPSQPLPPAGNGTKRQMWYWTDMTMDFLRPFENLNGGITRDGLRLAEQKCKISTWCHRAQIIGGRLYITDLRGIFYDRHYSMARVMPILETMRRWPGLPDLDAVFQGTDYPLSEIPRSAAHFHRLYGPGKPIPPMFSPTSTTQHLDIPWPDFAFFPPIGKKGCGKRCMHPLRTPRWTEAHPNLLAQGRAVAWEDKLPLAVFTGNMMGSLRKRLYQMAEAEHSDIMFVNEVFIKAAEQARDSCLDIAAPQPRSGGVLSKRCSLAFKDLCKYKYLINLGSNGYANKLRFLFLCGSTVLWVRKGSLNHEFFERQFLPGVHYAPVDTVEDLPDAIMRLRADDDFARRIALAGQERMAQMDVDEVTHYCYQMLKAYAKLQRFTPKRDPRSFEVNCEDDLVRHYDREGILKGMYLTEDNSTCLRPPPPGERLGPPGWGGAFANTKTPCLAAHDIHAPLEKGVCDAGYKYRHLDGEDWDVPMALLGGALPDWSQPDPAVTGKGNAKPRDELKDSPTC